MGSMKHRTHFVRVLGISLALISVLYLATGVFGYRTYGDMAKSPIYMNLPEGMIFWLGFFRKGSIIIITSHGAQLTGAMFMPQCGSFLEVFPKDYFTLFFATLAAAADLSYSRYTALDYDPNMNQKQMQGGSPFQRRVLARSQNLCLPPDELNSAILNMVKDWKQCVADAL